MENDNVKEVVFRRDFQNVDIALKEIRKAVEDGTLRNLITIMRVEEPDGRIGVKWRWQGKDTFVTYIGLMEYVKMSMHKKEFEEFEEVED